MLVLNKRNNTLGEGIAVWMQKPTRRTICFENGRKFFVSLPTTIFRVHYRDRWNGTNNLFCKSLKVGFITGLGVKKPTKTTQVFVPPLQNVLSNIGDEVSEREWLFACMGGNEPVVGRSADELCAVAVTSFWSTKFNAEVDNSGHELYKIRKIKPLNTFKGWAAKTKEDPTWVPSELIPCCSFEAFADTKNYIEIAFENDEYDYPQEDDY